MSKRGVIIAIEGLDRTGKTTQTERLLAHLSKAGKDHKLIKFPERTTGVGKLINQYLCDRTFDLNDQAAHLLFSANRWELLREITSSLEQGKIVILDRYVYSGVAYSCAKGLDFDWCLSPDKGLPRPDITIFLKFDEEVSASREGFGDERYEVVEFQEKVKQVFKRFDKEEEWMTICVDNKSIEQVEEAIHVLVEPLLDGTTKSINYF